MKLCSRRYTSRSPVATLITRAYGRVLDVDQTASRRVESGLADSFPDMIAAFKSKAIDAAFPSAPAATPIRNDAAADYFGGPTAPGTSAVGRPTWTPD
jgi:hypothetical protein